MSITVQIQYDITLYPEVLGYSVCFKLSRHPLHLQNAYVQNRKPAPFQVLLIFIFPREAVPRATGKSEEFIIINIRSQGGRQPIVYKAGCQQGQQHSLVEGRLSGWNLVTSDAAHTKTKLVADRFVFIIIEQMN